MKRVDAPEFWRRVAAVHGDRYQYVSEFGKLSLPITIRCPKHGLFDMLAGAHMRGGNCRKCCDEALAERMKGNSVRAMSVPPRALIPAEPQATAEAEREFFINLLEKLKVSYAFVE